MRTIFITSLLVLITFFNGLAQPGVEVHPQGYYSPGLFDNASNIGTLNPASIYGLKRRSAGLSYQFDTKIDDVFFPPGFSGKRILNLLPVNAGVIFEYSDLSLAFSFNKKYNFRDEILLERTTLENPGGTGEFFNAKREVEIYDYSALACYPVDILPGKSSLSPGIKLTLSNLKYTDNFYYYTDGSADIYAFAFAAGAEYKSELSEGSFFKFGLYYEKHFDYKGTFSISSPSSLTATGNNGTVISQIDFSMRDKIPEELNFNIDYIINPKVKVVERISNIYWHNVSGNFKNQVESFSKVLYSPAENITCSAGMFLTDRRAPGDSFINKDYFAMFLSAGVEVIINNFSYGLEIADSHIASSKARAVTSLKLFLWYSL